MSDFKLHAQKFAEALDRVISEPAFRSQLESRPAETLAEMGLEISAKDRAALVGRRLSEVIPREEPGGPRGLGQVAETYVHVGVDVAVSVVVSVAVGAEVERTLEAIEKVNLIKREKILKARGGRNR